jgi:hypothetical protein
VFSARGQFFPAALVDRVDEKHCGTVATPHPLRTDVCAPDLVARVVQILRRVNEEGTGVLPRRQPRLAAKTGTSASGGWHVAFDDSLRVLTWTESDFLSGGVQPDPGKAVSAKALASRIWKLLRSPHVGFAGLLGAFSGVDEMAVHDLLWVEQHFQQT